MAMDELRRFLLNPSGQFLRQRLQLTLPDITPPDGDLEPLGAPDPLQEAQLRELILHALLVDDTGHLYERLRARALLPADADGRRQCRALQTDLGPFADAVMQLHAGAAPQSVRCEVDIDGARIHAHVENIYPQAIVRVRPAQLSGRAAIRFGLDWLLANAAGMHLAMVFITADSKSRQPIQQRLEPVTADHAKAALGQLLQLRDKGLRAPLLFAPRTGWEIYCADDEDKARTNAYTAWHGGGNGRFAESEIDAIQLALRGRDLFGNADDYAELVRNSHVIYSALLSAHTSGSGQP